MLEGRTVAVVVPCRNEERLLGGVLAGLPDLVDHAFVIDDASADRTSLVAGGFGSRVSVLRHEERRGVGGAIATGYRAALAAGYDVVAVMAGDGQMAPSELEGLARPVALGRVDYAKGDRTRHPEVRRRMPLVRRLGNAVLSRWTRRIAGLETLRDAQCGFTVISARALAGLPLDRLWPGYGYPNDLLVMLGALGARVKEVPVTPIYGEARSGLSPLLAVITHSLVLLRAFLWARRIRREDDRPRLPAGAPP